MRVLTLGTFDIPHVGHVTFLDKAASLGDELIVGVNSDRFVERYKGERPLFSFDERAELLTRAGYTVRVNDGPGRVLVERWKPVFLVVGSDWHTRDYLQQIDVTQGELDHWGVSVAYVPYTPGISTSDIRARCA